MKLELKLDAILIKNIKYTMNPIQCTSWFILSCKNHVPIVSIPTLEANLVHSACKIWTILLQDLEENFLFQIWLHPDTSITIVNSLSWIKVMNYGDAVALVVLFSTYLCGHLRFQTIVSYPCYSGFARSQCKINF